MRDFMKKWICAVLLLCMCAGFVYGCGYGESPLEGDASFVYVDRKGRIRSLDVEELGESFYDVQELETFINDAVDEYTEVHGSNSVTVQGLTVEDGRAMLSMQYQSAEDYANLFNVEFFSGELLAALEAGYVFDGEFARVEEGQVVGAATKQEIYAEEGLKVVIIRANTDVQIDGSICYVSCENVKLEGPGRVSIREGYQLDNGAAATEAIPGAGDNGGTEEADSGSTGNAQAAGSVALDTVQESDVYTFIVYR